MFYSILFYPILFYSILLYYILCLKNQYPDKPDTPKINFLGNKSVKTHTIINLQVEKLYTKKQAETDDEPNITN
jgi:hypothetical protein